MSQYKFDDDITCQSPQVVTPSNKGYPNKDDMFLKSNKIQNIYDRSKFFSIVMYNIATGIFCSWSVGMY